MAKGVDRKREIRRKKKAYARTLKDQVRLEGYFEAYQYHSGCLST